MKRNKLILLGSVLLLVSTNFAQNAQAPKEKLEDRIHNALSAMMQFAHREARVVEQIGDDTRPARIVDAQTRIWSPPDRYHSIREEYTPVGIVTSEMISIAGKRYTKTRNDPWIEEPGYGGGQGTRFDKYFVVNPQPVIETREGKCEPDSLNGKTTTRCEIIRTVTRNSEKDSSVTRVAETHWFNEKGLLVKSVNKATDDGSKIVFVTTTTYEYDPTIKIEAPIS